MSGVLLITRNDLPRPEQFSDVTIGIGAPCDRSAGCGARAGVPHPTTQVPRAATETTVDSLMENLTGGIGETGEGKQKGKGDP